LNLYKLDGFVTDLALNNPLFNAISPVIESAKISRIFLVVLANSLAIDLSMQDYFRLISPVINFIVINALLSAIKSFTRLRLR
jgi:hypothetical protein